MRECYTGLDGMSPASRRGRHGHSTVQSAGRSGPRGRTRPPTVRARTSGNPNVTGGCGSCV